MCLTLDIHPPSLPQRVYFSSRTHVTFDSVFGVPGSAAWHCLDCCISDFCPLPIGVCCCSFRRQRVACALHPGETQHSKLHCHTYRRKPFPKLLDIAVCVFLRAYVHV